MQVQLNDKIGFGYNIKFKVKGRTLRKYPEFAEQIKESIMHSMYNPYGGNNDLRVVINSFNLRNFIDQLRFKNPITNKTSQYQLSVRFYKAANTFPQKVKKLGKSIRAFFLPLNKKARLATKPVQVFKTGESSLQGAVKSMCCIFKDFCQYVKPVNI